MVRGWAQLGWGGPITEEYYRHKLWQAQHWVLQPNKSSSRKSSERAVLLIIPTFMPLFASLIAAEDRCRTATLERDQHWRYREKTNAESAEGILAFRNVSQLLEAAGCRSPNYSCPPLGPDWDWRGDIMLCLPSSAFLLFSACHGEMLSVSWFCLDPPPFLLPHTHY